jgi:hypothetical protein
MQLSVTSWSFPACTLPEAWAVARALGLPEWTSACSMAPRSTARA